MILVQSPLYVRNTWSEVYAKCIETYFAADPNVKVFRSVRVVRPVTDKELVVAMLEEGARFLQWVGALHLTEKDWVLCFDPFASVERLPFVTDAKIAVYLHQEMGRYYGCDHWIVKKLWDTWAQFDKVFVPTYYALNKLGLGRRSNVHAVGGMLDYDQYYTTENKDKTVLWAARICEEKGVKEFVAAIPIIREHGYEPVMLTNNVQDAELAKLIPEGVLRQGLGKEDYKDQLAKAEFFVSTARQETFGVAVAEAIASGCKVIAPDAHSYPEMLPKSNMYRPGMLRDDIVASMESSGSFADVKQFDYRNVLRRVWVALQ